MLYRKYNTCQSKVINILFSNGRNYKVYITKIIHSCSECEWGVMLKESHSIDNEANIEIKKNICKKSFNYFFLTFCEPNTLKEQMFR